MRVDSFHFPIPIFLQLFRKNDDFNYLYSVLGYISKYKQKYRSYEQNFYQHFEYIKA